MVSAIKGEAVHAPSPGSPTRAGFARGGVRAPLHPGKIEFENAKLAGGSERSDRKEGLMHHTWTKGEFEISTDPDRIDLPAVHEFLTNSYWARGIPPETVQHSIENSICFGIYKGDCQVGFARVVTDRATFAYLADVFVLPDYRGRGLSKWMMECILAHPDLQGLRRWMLATKDAHGLYCQFGFTTIKSSERWMEIHDPDVYARIAASLDQKKKK